MFTTICIKIPAGLIMEIDKLILKIIWKYKGSRIVKKKKSFRKTKVRGITFSNFKLYCKAAVIKAVWSWHDDEHVYISGI